MLTEIYINKVNIHRTDVYWHLNRKKNACQVVYRREPTNISVLIVIEM